MKREDWKSAYEPLPDSLNMRVSSVLTHLEEEKPVKKICARTIALAAALIIALAGIAYAAFSSEVAELFGRYYGNDMKEWLEKGEVATPNAVYSMDGVVFTLEEVVYRDNGLYGVGTIKPEDGGKVFLIALDHTPDEPYGYDIYGEGGKAETAPNGAPTIAETVKAADGRLLIARVFPQAVGVDGGEILTIGSVGMTTVPQRDGSLRFSFELSDGFAVEKGKEYAIQMYVSLCEMSLDGERNEDTLRRGTWLANIAPVPINTAAASPAVVQAGAPAADVQIIAPDAFKENGTLPVYKATARDFGANLDPELFNQSGIAERGTSQIIFKDEAELSWSPEALFYSEYSGSYNTNDREPEQNRSSISKPTLANKIASLASHALAAGETNSGAPETLEKTELSTITLAEAKSQMEALLAKLSMEGYVCDNALDMSLERIYKLSNWEKEQSASGELSADAALYDVQGATEADEGYYLSYHKLIGEQSKALSDIFSAYAYVTERGIVWAAFRDMYIQGEIYSTPQKLVSAESVIAALPGEIMASRFPGEVVSVQSAVLAYAPMRAENKQDGMVLSPVWIVSYQDGEAAKQGFDCWANFDAVDGHLISASFK